MIHVRKAHIDDVDAINAVYNEDLVSSYNNYASEPMSQAARVAWLQGLELKGYPVFVAEKEQTVVGFGALTPFHPLDGYRFTATGSIYVRKDMQGTGVGKLMGQALIKAARQKEIHTIIAGINAENKASIAFHKSFGFEQVGYFKQIGHKHGQWHDDVCMQLVLS